MEIKRYGAKEFLAAGKLCIRENEIHIWCICWPEMTDFWVNHEYILSGQESEQVGRFRFSEDRMRYIAGKVVVRLLLKRYLDVETIDFSVSERGKPYHKKIAGKQTVDFNISHVLNSNSYIRNEEKEYYFEKKMHYSELEKIWVDGKNVWENANLGTISTYEYFKNNRITDEYVRKIEQLHYKNINLIGYCLGGILALNVAVKLLEKGIEVNNLFVIDSYPVSGKVEDEFIDEVIFLPNYQLMLSEVLEDVDDFKVMEFITEVRKRNNGNIPQNTFFNIIEKDSKMKNNSGLWEFVNSTKEKRFEAYAKAIEKKTCINVSAELLEATFEIYQHGFKGANVELPFYSGDICYLSACEEQKYFFADKNQNLEMWNDICLGEFEVINVPGNHVTCIHSEENATLLAQIIIERNIRG